MTTQPTILIIIGITGDLSRRKLLPAIEQLARSQVLPEQCRVLGISRQAIDTEELLADGEYTFLRSRLAMHQMNLAKTADYKQLAVKLAAIEQELGVRAQRLFYLSVPPQISGPIVQHLGESGLAQIDNTKLLLEKPFGTDFGSAQDLIAETKRYFTEAQLYRIDHYLAKEMAQNLIVFRAGNALLNRTWNKDFIESIDIIASEQIGIEGRAAFYEQTGALRDVVQSHLLQLAALVLMQPSAKSDLSDVPSNRLSALRALHLPPQQPITQAARRAQYLGYRDEVANARSTVETYANLTLASHDPAWQNVPIRLITGKALAAKQTAIRITYKKERDHEANQLIITLQPNEGIELRLWAKEPGYIWKVEEHALRLGFTEQFATLPEAYEQVLLDALLGSHTLFTTSDEVLETWRILQPIQDAWALQTTDLQFYAPGSQADAIL